MTWSNCGNMNASYKIFSLSIEAKRDGKMNGAPTIGRECDGVEFWLEGQKMYIIYMMSIYLLEELLKVTVWHILHY